MSEIEIVIAVIFILVAALIVALHKAHEERKEKNALYRQLMLPTAAQTVALPRHETPEYKLERAENSLRFVRSENDRLTAENQALAAQKFQLMTEAAGLRSSYAALEQDYLRQFNAGRGVVTDLVSLTMENERLRKRLAEESSSRQLAELKLRRYESADRADPCHAAS